MKAIFIALFALILISCTNPSNHDFDLTQKEKIECLIFFSHNQLYEHKYKDGINISLRGDYTPIDSTITVNVLKNIGTLYPGLKPSSEQVNANFVINFSTHKKGSLTTNSSFSKYPTVKKNTMVLNPEETNSLTHKLKKQLYTYKIVHHLLAPIYYGSYEPRREADILKNSVLVVNDYRKYEMTKYDKYLLDLKYNKNFNWEFLKLSHGDYIFFLKSKFKYTISLLYTILLFIIISLYFLVLIKYHLIVTSHNLKKLLFNSILLAGAYQILALGQILYYTNLRLEIIQIDKVLPIIVGIYFGVMIVSVIIYYAEKMVKTKSLINDLTSKFLISITVSFTAIILFTSACSRLDHIHGSFSINHAHEYFLLTLVIIAYRSISSYLNYKVTNAVKEKDLELANMERIQHQTALQVLHSRINPHFLYNTLNSIASLAKPNPEETEKMALALSDFCRYAINKENKPMVTVSEEIEMAKTYLEIEKIRFGKRFSYLFNADNHLADLQIPRFIIQPLCENAIKHGVSNVVGEAWIKIDITIQNNFLLIQIADNGPVFPNDVIQGYGLQSIQEKLELMYKGAAYMKMQNEPIKSIMLFLPIK